MALVVGVAGRLGIQPVRPTAPGISSGGGEDVGSGGGESPGVESLSIIVGEAGKTEGNRARRA